MSPLGCLIAAAAAYVGIVLLIARLASEKWHPDGGSHDYT